MKGLVCGKVNNKLIFSASSSGRVQPDGRAASSCLSALTVLGWMLLLLLAIQMKLDRSLAVTIGCCRLVLVLVVLVVEGNT